MQVPADVNKAFTENAAADGVEQQGAGVGSVVLDIQCRGGVSVGVRTHANTCIGGTHYPHMVATRAVGVAPHSGAYHALKSLEDTALSLCPQRSHPGWALRNAPHADRFLGEAIGLALDGIGELGVVFVGAQHRNGAIRRISIDSDGVRALALHKDAVLDRSIEDIDGAAYKFPG